MARTLIEVIDHLDEIDDADRFASLIIYADGGRDALPSARTIVCPGDEEGTFACPLDSTLDEVLTVQLAREAIEVWSLWRGGKSPNREEKLAAVMFYSQNDAYLPLEDEPR
ncbi:MAG: hypothetical protein ACTHK7_24650 [Aureliella sp.]